MSYHSSSTNDPLLNKKRKSEDTSTMKITIKKVKLSGGIESYIHIEDVKIPMNEEKNSFICIYAWMHCAFRAYSYGLRQDLLSGENREGKRNRLQS